jgi:hypothetical protein
VGLWAGSSWLRIETCECGNKPSDYIKCEKFLDEPRTGLFLKKDSAPWSS